MVDICLQHDSLCCVTNYAPEADMIMKHSVGLVLVLIVVVNQSRLKLVLECS